MSNHSTRCGACKSMRRRCPKDCIFAPYFPPNDLDRFTCVHKIFGASKIAKMLEQIPEGRREDAAESMVAEAKSRVRDPVYGSVGILTQLRQQIMEAEYELAKTRGLIALCKAQVNHQHKLTQDTLSTLVSDDAQINDFPEFYDPFLFGLRT
ncbi:hypothetical protein RND81_05G237700 [Saponaria officinalis]|uniref:LOB domain-containing protein n=1 Tax=Saponaria officinalis TaxID=3572 RepID=A0AAW1KWD4_SAPOF